MAYILITPAKDEEDNLPFLIDSIINQTLKPVVWFIVNDGSKDRTLQIVNEASLKYSWIHSVSLSTGHTYDIGMHYASICIKGFDSAIDYCRQNNISFEYIALSDADMIYPPGYFTECINFLHNNSQYGIVSGKLLVKDKQGNIYDENKICLGDGFPYGTGRVWERACFIQTNGYMPVKSPDAVSNIMALSKGWEIKQLHSIVFYQTRGTGEKSGFWNGYFNRGERTYYLNANLLSVLNTIIATVFISREKHSLIKSLAFLSGYCKSYFRSENHIENDEIKRYTGSYGRIIRNYWLFLKWLIRK